MWLQAVKTLHIAAPPNIKSLLTSTLSLYLHLFLIHLVSFHFLPISVGAATFSG